MKTKIISLFLVVLMAFALAACGDTTAPSGGSTTAPQSSNSGDATAAPAAPTDTANTVIGDGTGIYEGETDANGLFSGYGVWIYHNYRYEGYFENGVPNGEGTLYIGYPAERGATSPAIVVGQWVDGLANGLITETTPRTSNTPDTWSGDTFTYSYEVENGRAVRDEEVERQGGGYPSRILVKGELMAGVPPWAEVKTDSSVTAPLGSEAPVNTSNSNAPQDITDSVGDTLPSDDTPNSGTSALSDWVGTYTNGSVTITIVSENNGRGLGLTISKDGSIIHEEPLNVGYALEPGQMAPGGHHEDPMKSLTEHSTLLLSEDYQTIALSRFLFDDSLVGEYKRQ